MSRQLALSTAFSVLMMSAFVLFNPAAARTELGPERYSVPAPLNLSILPQATVLLPR